MEHYPINNPQNPRETEDDKRGPNHINRTLPIRLPYTAYRVREYLTEKEVERLIEAARKHGRNDLQS